MKKDPRIIQNQLKPIRKDIIFCMHYFRIGKTPAVYIDHIKTRYYMQFFHNHKKCYEASFLKDLETALYVALRPHEEKA